MENQPALSLIVRTLWSHFGDSLQGIMLYGSRAQGHHRPDSDFDVAVLCDCNIPAYTCWLVAQDIAVSVNRDVDLVDLWQAATVLRKEVVANGRWLYQRDRGQCEEFVASTLSQYQQLNIERREILAATKARLRGGRETVVVDAVRLDKRVVIERCLDRVDEEYRGHEAELLTNLTRQDAIVLNIQRACQACIDMGNHCLVRLKVVTVQDAREVFDLLAARQLISTDLAQSMKKMVGFRNIAVHEYQRLDMNIMKAVIENHLEDLRSLGEVLTEAMGKTP